jgi:hypothetical protein
MKINTNQNKLIPKIMNPTGLIMVFMLIFTNANAQERLETLPYNSTLINHIAKTKGQTVLQKMLTVGLPFIDDFSYNNVYPSDFYWTDSSVYINNTYSKDQLSYGIATFDGLTKYGTPYNSIPYSYGYADTLTSQRINLFPYNESDSIYMSFYYQPQGLGQDPQPEDSLIVEFKNKFFQWNQVWAKAGQGTHAFKIVMLPIDTSLYYFSSFQFRIINKATLSGNNDHWNIDYVKIAKNRTKNDTILNDIALSLSPKNFLKNYQSMPYNQYKADTTNEKDVQKVYLHNNSILSDNCQIACETKNLTLGTIDYFNPGVANIVSGSSDYNFTFTSPYINISTPPSTTSITIENKFWLNPGAASANYKNDTIYQKVELSNYYAHDDGTAEKAYALYGAATKLAYKFTTNIADSIQYVAIHWAHMNADVSNKLINIIVWRHIDENNSGEGDDTIAVFTLLKPEYRDTINSFYYYPIKRLLPAGDFYIGFQQLSPDYLNIGFDVNNDVSNKIFYNTSGAWANTSFAGALMMRPYLGSYFPNPNLGIDATENTIECYPNPTENTLFINTEKQIQSVEIYNTTGQMMCRQYAKTIDVSDLSAGYYILKIYENNTNILPLLSKFIKK